MKDKVFLDTNILYYIFSQTSMDKASKAEKLIIENGASIILSSQVLSELYHSITKSYKNNELTVKEYIHRITDSFRITSVGWRNVFKAIEIKMKYRFQYWDCLIISSALMNDCAFLYTPKTFSTIRP